MQGSRGVREMMIYVALLRGINVGGHNKIRMDELKHMFEAIGFRTVQTYIQSGNVLFEAAEPEEPVCLRIEQGILQHFGIASTVLLRTAEELAQIAAQCPFEPEAVAAAEASAEGESLYVCMLRDPLPSEAVDRLQALQTPEDQFRLVGREVYLLFGRSVRHSKAAAALQKLAPASTVRNWKTVSRLAALAKAMEA